jgi:hypothetical protein
VPEFPHPSPSGPQLDDLVRGYEQLTGDLVRTQRKRNLIATCHRVHGDEFLPLVRETFVRTGTATNLLGELRGLSPRSHAQDVVPDSATEVTSQADTDSAWCGCPEEALSPELLYCSSHYRYGYASKLRLDRRPSNPGAALFFAVTAGQPETVRR